jgi:hypothetical protein
MMMMLLLLLLLLLQWDNFMHQMEPLVSAVPYMTTQGNHERDWPNSGDRFTTAYDSGGCRCPARLDKIVQLAQQPDHHMICLVVAVCSCAMEPTQLLPQTPANM